MNSATSPKVVVGFSGGLDTSYCVKYLSEELGYEVHTVIVNTGGFTDDELAAIEQHAYYLGARTHTAIDATQEYYSRIIKYLVFGNVLKNNTYPLCVSAERLIQAINIAEHVKKINAAYVAHGSTGAGNDQVRFDMIFNILIPEVPILTPIRDQALSREAEIQYLRDKGVTDMNFEKSHYSINQGLWGTSVGGRETLESMGALPEEAWPVQVSQSGPQEVSLSFTEGELSAVNDIDFENKVEAIQYLKNIAAPFGIGRDIHVGDTIIGIKGRVGFEAAAPLIIIKAHHLLEKHVLTKWQQTIKNQMAELYGNWLHEGLILDPVMRDIEALFSHSQQHVTGTVKLVLHPYRFSLLGVESQYDLMQSEFGKYGEMNTGYTGNDVRGFSKIFGNQIRIYQKTAEKIKLFNNE